MSSNLKTSLPLDSSPAAEQRSPTPDAAIDRGLISRFVGGDEKAFVQIMERHQRKIFNAVHALLHNYADTEEITQDTFIRAHRGLAKFRGDSSLSTWLHRIAINLARNRYWFYFRRRRQDSLSLDLPFAESTGTFGDLIADEAHDPARGAVVAEFASLVERCMARLETAQREILTLRNVANYSYEEIAKEVGINIGTVKSRIARAREQLRVLIAETCPEFVPGAAISEWFLPSRGTAGELAIACA
ncbi:MAG TPA: RNA polymerase sigma factor [Opitutaceae bacterium]|nr:RNA polymerase sigma factor [Opitutaceae bacterium]